jgi:hypothetical protein
MAYHEACRTAAHRGTVLEATGVVRSRIDFILFVEDQVVFVRVKRSHSRIRSPQEVMVLFRSEIAELRRIPHTTVASREIWVMLPWGGWQYFCIGDESITEIMVGSRNVPGKNNDGKTVPGTQGPVSDSMLFNGPVLPNPDSPVSEG